jgi:hypothetical protein
MEPTFAISIFGLAIYSILAVLAYRHSDGKWKVAEHKKPKYNYWVNNHGRRVKRSIFKISIIFGLGMLIQLLSLV